MNNHATHVALADDIPIPFDWSEHDERPDCWCEPDVDVRTETDEELRARIETSAPHWIAPQFFRKLAGVTGSHLDEMAWAVSVVVRRQDVPVYLHRRPVEYDMVTGVGRVVR